MRLVRGSRIGVIAAVALASLPFAVRASSAGATGGPVTTMLVFLRSGGAVHGFGRAAERGAQASVASLATDVGGAVIATTLVPDTMTMTLTAAAAAVLSRSPLVSTVLDDSTIPGPSNPMLATRTTSPTRAARTSPAQVASCGTPKSPQLNPEALANINDASPRATLGFIGRGVKVAFLADGLAVGDADFLRNAAYASTASRKGTRVIARYVDFSGDGTAAPTFGGEAFLDASSIAAQGNAVYDLRRYVDASHPLPKGCDVRIVGAAPGATVYALKVFAENNATTGSGFVQAINYAVANGVKVINESFGSNPMPDTAADIVKAADDAAVAAGVTVVVSTGDAGITSTIGSPASDPNVISVGASTTFRSYQQDAFGGINLPGERGGYRDNNISSLSSGGIAQDGKTVDLVAPGDLNWTLCSAQPSYSDCSGASLQLSGGTSESSPLTAGAAADVIQAYESSHHGAFPTPQLVKQILMSSATDIAAPAIQQGAGLLNVGRAVRLALSIAGSTHSPAPGGLLADAEQVDLSGLPSGHVTNTFSVTNTGPAVAHVAITTRGLVPVHVVAGHVTLNPLTSSRQPRFSIWSGATEVYQRATFRVGARIDRIQLQAGYRFVQQSSVVHVALFAPNGDLAGYSNPQGQGDYADVEVARPASGVWTAAFFTVWDGYHGETGTTGPEPWSFTELRYRASGAVVPSSFVIAPGATRSVQYAATLPATPGDSAASIVLDTAGSVTTIPVTLRTLIPTGVGGGHFSGVLTGGNGRGGAPGQTNTYDFTVPVGEHDLDVGVRMSSNPAVASLPGDQLVATLADPSGEVVAYDSNYTLNDAGEIVTRYVNLYRANPTPGAWTLVLEWAQPVTGARTSVPFTGSVEFNQVSMPNNLPDSPSATVPQAGAQFAVMVHNTGVAPMIVSPDARLTTTTTLPLVDQQYAATQDLPNASNLFYVPTETSSASISVSSTVPVTFDASFQTGDPDLSPTVPEPYVVGGATSTSASLSFTPPGGLSPGYWGVVPAELGPYPPSGEPQVAETTTATAQTLAFDPAVTSLVTDTVLATTNGGSISPDIVAPGASVSIPITITPTAGVGTTVTGTLFINGVAAGSQYVNTLLLTAFFTSDLAAIPYEYKVGP
jgi:hypothetical protein